MFNLNDRNEQIDTKSALDIIAKFEEICRGLIKTISSLEEEHTQAVGPGYSWVTEEGVIKRIISKFESRLEIWNIESIYCNDSEIRILKSKHYYRPRGKQISLESYNKIKKTFHDTKKTLIKQLDSLEHLS